MYSPSLQAEGTFNTVASLPALGGRGGTSIQKAGRLAKEEEEGMVGGGGTRMEGVLMGRVLGGGGGGGGEM